MKRIAASVLIATTVLLIGGCFGSQQTIPTERFYRLSAPAAPASTIALAVDKATVFVIEAVDARGVYVERSLLYRSSIAGAPLQQYPYASWAEPPDVMLQDLLLACLRGAFSATQVMAPGQRGVPAIRVSMRLHAMEQIRDGSAARARFAATYTAINHNGAVLFVLDWDREAAASGSSPLEFVNALNGLVDDADRELIEQLRKVASKTGG